MGQLYGYKIWFVLSVSALMSISSDPAFSARIPPKPTPTPTPTPEPNPRPPIEATGEMEFAITPFANMEHGWHVFEPGYRAVCVDSQGVVASAKMSIDAAINGETADSRGAYQALIIRPETQYQRVGLTSGQCEMTICLDQNADDPKSPPACKPVRSIVGGDSERALSFKRSVSYKTIGDKISLQTGAPGLSAWHPAFSFAAPGKAFKDFQSPLVVDINGDGQFDLTSAWDEDRLVRFDLALDGRPYPTGWVGATDGFLAIDLNGNGRIDDGRELFGEMTAGSVGGKKTYENGFLALSRYDSNLDGLIDQRDREYGRIRIWIDSNRNGLTESGELRTLAKSKIKSISLSYKSMVEPSGNYPMVAGNEIRLMGVVRMNDGIERQIADVWFKQRRLSDHATAMTRWLMNTADIGK
jgi:hypothetical protein